MKGPSTIRVPTREHGPPVGRCNGYPKICRSRIARTTGRSSEGDNGMRYRFVISVTLSLAFASTSFAQGQGRGAGGGRGGQRRGQQGPARPAPRWPDGQINLGQV